MSGQIMCEERYSSFITLEMQCWAHVLLHFAIDIR